MGSSRRRKSPPFVMLYHKWMETPAWLHLSGNGVKLFLLVLKLYNGENNGQIVLGQRDASLALGVARNTISAAFEELEVKGFIRPARKGSFSQNMARRSG